MLLRVRSWVLLVVAATACSHDWDELRREAPGAGGGAPATSATTTTTGGGDLTDSELCDALCEAWEFCVEGFLTCASTCKTSVRFCPGLDQRRYNECLPIIQVCDGGSPVAGPAFQACIEGRCDIGFDR